ncbi:cobalamin biosynthesis protein CobD [bacterium E08(2017)]|nr:cobalamin biosynthesis protein CobD [bacterium E08(2017)]
MDEYMHLIVLAAAFLVDSIFGDPRYTLHPVRLIGAMINAGKALLFEFDLKGRISGFLLAIIVILLSINSYILLYSLLDHYLPQAVIILNIYVIWSTIALKDMTSHAKPIADSLEQNDIDEARKRVDMIVGRDCSKLDEHGIARAAVESVAENFVDGFFAPIMWFTVATFIRRFYFIDPSVAGIFALITYRAVNTMDAMIGHKNDEFRYFGTFAARLDDVLNFLPARLSLIVLTPASAICRLNTGNAVKTFLRDRKKHESPNSAHSESFTAGALGLKLGGPTIYPYGNVEKPWLGDGSEQADHSHIRSACRLITIAGWITIISALITLFAAI